MLRITDVHAHYDEKAFDCDRGDILTRLHADGVSFIVNSGSDVPSSQRSVNLAHEYDFVYASVGVFPLSAYDVPDGWIDSIRSFASDERVVAIGEIGLDYHEADADREVQKRVFRAQLDLARDLGLPVVIHDREADEDVLEELDKRPVKAMIHRFFSRSEYGKAFAERGIGFGIGPAITYPDAGELIKTVEAIDSSLILLETDAPFLPSASRAGMRADSSDIIDVISAISRIKGISEEDVAEIAYRNAAALFGIRR